jgi:hypothetical protein
LGQRFLAETSLSDVRRSARVSWNVHDKSPRGGAGGPEKEISTASNVPLAAGLAADPTAGGVCRSVAKRDWVWADIGHAISQE